MHSKFRLIPSINRILMSIQNIRYGKSIIDELILELKNKSYDIIESHGVIHHLEDSEKALEVLANNLKKGGLLSLAIYNKMGILNIIFGPHIVFPYRPI